MPSFSFEHNTPLSADEAFGKVRQYFQESEGIKKLDDNMQFKFDEKAKTGHVKGSKFEVSMKVTGANPATVSLQVSLSLLLTPFKGTIEKTIKEKMAKILG